MTADSSTQTENSVQVFPKLSTHPLVNGLFSSAKVYYDSAKSSNVIIRYGCEQFEVKLSSAGEWVKPTVDPYLQTETFRKYSQQVDQIGSTTLDKLGDATQKVTQTLCIAKKGAWNAAENGLQTIETKLIPVDTYLRDSIVGLPLNYTLTLTEKVCDRFLPESETPEPKLETKAGPIMRTKKLSKKLQRQALQKMKGLNFRSPESLQSMKYCVDLIQYAKQNIDSGVKVTNQFFGESVNKGIEISKTGMDFAQKNIIQNPQVQQVTVKIEKYTQDGITALKKAIEILGQQIPNVQAKSYQFKEKVFDSTLFTSVASKTSQSLHEINDLIRTNFNEFQKKQPEIVALVYQKLNDVLQTLSSLYPQKRLNDNALPSTPHNKDTEFPPTPESSSEGMIDGEEDSQSPRQGNEEFSEEEEVEDEDDQVY